MVILGSLAHGRAISQASHHVQGSPCACQPLPIPSPQQGAGVPNGSPPSLNASRCGPPFCSKHAFASVICNLMAFLTMAFNFSRLSSATSLPSAFHKQSVHASFANANIWSTIGRISVRSQSRRVSNELISICSPAWPGAQVEFPFSMPSLGSGLSIQIPVTASSTICPSSISGWVATRMPSLRVKNQSRRHRSQVTSDDALKRLLLLA